MQNLARMRGWKGALVWIPTVAAVAVLYLAQTSPPAICLANYERSTAGMSEREVKTGALFHP